MDTDVPEVVKRYIQSHYTMTLATCVADRPWAATLFYAVDDGLRLYFVSDPGSRHVTQALRNPRVAATISEHDQPWRGIQGLQIEGVLVACVGSDREAVEAVYFRRFPEMRTLARSASDEMQRNAAHRLDTAGFYAVMPGLVRFIDNTRGFGHKDEFILDRDCLHDPHAHGSEG